MSGVDWSLKPTCTCKDLYRAELGSHEGTCPLSLMMSGKFWIKKSRFGEWEEAQVSYST